MNIKYNKNFKFFDFNYIDVIRSKFKHASFSYDDDLLVELFELLKNDEQLRSELEPLTEDFVINNLELIVNLMKLDDKNKEDILDKYSANSIIELIYLIYSEYYNLIDEMVDLTFNNVKYESERKESIKEFLKSNECIKLEYDVFQKLYEIYPGLDDDLHFIEQLNYYHSRFKDLVEISYLDFVHKKNMKEFIIFSDYRMESNNRKSCLIKSKSYNLVKRKKE